MKAILVRRHGDESVLRYEELPDPVPGAGEVLVRVRAAGINFADILARLGVYKAAPPPPSSPASRWRAPWRHAAPSRHASSPGTA